MGFGRQGRPGSAAAGSGRPPPACGPPPCPARRPAGGGHGPLEQSPVGLRRMESQAAAMNYCDPSGGGVAINDKSGAEVHWGFVGTFGNFFC